MHLNTENKHLFFNLALYTHTGVQQLKSSAGKNQWSSLGSQGEIVSSCCPGTSFHRFTYSLCVRLGNALLKAVNPTYGVDFWVEFKMH